MPGLFSRFSGARLDLRNRIVLPPMATELAGPTGHVTAQLIDHYQARTGVGMIIVEHSFVDEAGKNSPRQLSAAEDSVISGLGELAAAIKQRGTTAVLQINHAGAVARSEVTGCRVVAPWDKGHPRNTEDVVPLTADGMGEIVDKFAAAARRAVTAGFDAVEIHGAHGFLLSQFLSPLTNTRPDAYGGDIKGRSRFPLEVTAAVIDAVGQDYPVLYRAGVDDFSPGGLTLAEGIEFCKLLVSAGIEVIDVSGGIGGFRKLSGPGFLLGQARAVKEHTGAVVINAGGLEDPEVADRAITQGMIDLAAVGRAMLSEPDWPQRARSIICEFSA